MQEAYPKGPFAPPETCVFATGNYSAGHEEWFPANPDCPNHKIGVPFSSAFADPNPSGQVSCADCFLHSTIIQSMNLSCQHLHACSNCASCYSHQSGHSQNLSSGLSPSLHPSNSPPQVNISPPLLPHSASRMLRYKSPATFAHNPAPHLRQRSGEDLSRKRSSFVPEQEKHNLEHSLPHPRIIPDAHLLPTSSYHHHEVSPLPEQLQSFPQNTRVPKDTTQATLQDKQLANTLQPEAKLLERRVNSTTAHNNAKSTTNYQNSKCTKSTAVSFRHTILDTVVVF